MFGMVDRLILNSVKLEDKIRSKFKVTGEKCFTFI